ncbi:MAG: hypothetical protein ABJN57_00825 [Hyphomicrobiales bacterium]
MRANKKTSITKKKLSPLQAEGHGEALRVARRVRRPSEAQTPKRLK